MQKSTDGSPLGFGLSWMIGEDDFGKFYGHSGGVERQLKPRCVFTLTWTWRGGDGQRERLRAKGSPMDWSAPGRTKK